MAIAWTIVSCCIAIIFWILYGNRPAVIHVPDPPRLPVPNAYDVYVEAALLTGGTEEEIPDPTDCSDDEKAALLKRYAPALQRLRDGFSLNCIVPPETLETLTTTLSEMPETPIADTRMGKFSGLRKLARILAIEAALKAKQGDTAGAISSTVDAIKLGADIGRDGSLIEYLIGIAIDAIGMNSAFRCVDKLDCDAARETAQRLMTIYDSLPSLNGTINEEYRFSMLHLQNVLQHWNWRFRLISESLCIFSIIDMLVLPVTNAWRALFLTKQGVVKDRERVWQEYIARASRSYQEAKNVRPLKVTWINELAVPVSPVVTLLAANRKVQISFLACTLALHAYKLEHRENPNTLDELIPGYLVCIPIDPFGHGEHLSYKRTNGDYILYSVGPDGIDDGGKHFKEPEENIFSSLKASHDSIGDIVLESSSLSRVSWSSHKS